MRKFNTDQIINYKPLISSASAFIFLRNLYYYAIKDHYRRFADCCWLVRVAKTRPLSTFGQRIIEREIAAVSDNGKNRILESFLHGSYPQKYIKKYSISGVGKQDIFRDIIILKSATTDEKGVILLKYSQTFEAFLYFFDVPKLAENYYFVLEPCWAGYHITNILMWLSPKLKNNVLVQCYTREDFEFISTLKPFLVPIKLGPADWVNAENFRPNPNENKVYDLIMVANWALIKHHKLLFKALKKIQGRKLNICLIGYAWGGRTSQDILDEAKIINNTSVNIDIKENLSHRDVVKYLNKSKVFVFLTRKEGDNKALVEAMFTNVPVIVYKETIGGASSRVNEQTGILSSFEELDSNINYMLDNYKSFSPREWAQRNTGSENATALVNNVLKGISLKKGESYATGIVEKINSPNLAYKDSTHYKKFEADYDYLSKARRAIPSSRL